MCLRVAVPGSRLPAPEPGTGDGRLSSSDLQVKFDKSTVMWREREQGVGWREQGGGWREQGAGWREVPTSPRTLPRPGVRSRGKSPVARPHLSLLLCPEFEDGEVGGWGSSYSPTSPSCSPALGRRFPPTTSLPRPHALARARGAELLHCSSLPCSPVLARLGRREAGRELSLPSSPVPRIHIDHADQQVRPSTPPTGSYRAISMRPGVGIT